MKKSVLILALFAGISLAHGARAPKWVDDVEAEYPKETYIARLGTGDSVDNARASAVAQIASFFKSEVAVSTSATQRMKNDGEKTARSQEIDQSVRVVSDMTLTAVDYSAPHYDKKRKTYFVVAYIERTQGVQAVEAEAQKLRAQYDSFLALSKKAAEPVMAYKHLVRAREAGEELLSALHMGFLLESSKKRDYQSFAAELSQNEAIGTLGSRRILVLVESDGDYENAVSAKAAEALAPFGFLPVSDKRKPHEAVLSVRIDCNEKPSDDIVAIYPEVTVSLLSADKNTTFYRFRRAWGRTAAFSLSAAQKKAFPTIADELNEELAQDFRKRFLLN